MERIDIAGYIKSLETEESKEYARQKECESAQRETICAPLRNATDFTLHVENWNFVSEVGYPPDSEWCFIITPSQVGCLYDWGVAGYSKKEKQFYANFGMGGLVTKQEDVIAWKTFTDFEKDDWNALPSFLTVRTKKCETKNNHTPLQLEDVNTMTVGELTTALSVYADDCKVKVCIEHPLLFRLSLTLDHVAPIIEMDTNKVNPNLELLPLFADGWYSIIKRYEDEKVFSTTAEEDIEANSDLMPKMLYGKVKNYGNGTTL